MTAIDTPACRRLWISLCLTIGVFAMTHAWAQEGVNETPVAEELAVDGEVPESIENAAMEVLAEIPGLRDAGVEMHGRVLVIDGDADDRSVIEAAESAVAASTGVATIENRIELSRNVQERTRGAASRLSGRVDAWLAYLPLVPLAVAVFVLFAIIAWLAGRADALYRRLTPNPFLQNIQRKVLQSAILLAGVLFALEILDATALVGGVLGAAGVVGIAIGFAFRDLIENYIASVLLSLRQPFRPQDHVVIDGHEGLVTAMNTRSTILTTFDGNVVRIPNAIVFKSALVNYSADSRRRFMFAVGVGYGVNLGQAIDTGISVLSATAGVMTEPGPSAVVSELGDSRVTVQFYAWVDQASADFGKVRSNAMQQVKSEFERLGIDMPEPIYTVRLQDASAPAGAGAPATVSSNGDAPTKVESRTDVSLDDTIVSMSEQAARDQQGGNLLDAKAPVE